MNHPITETARRAHACDRVIEMAARGIKLVQFLREEGFKVLSMMIDSDRDGPHIQITSDDRTEYIENMYSTEIDVSRLPRQLRGTSLHYTWRHDGCTIGWVKLEG